MQSESGLVYLQQIRFLYPDILISKILIKLNTQTLINRPLIQCETVADSEEFDLQNTNRMKFANSGL